MVFEVSSHACFLPDQITWKFTTEIGVRSDVDDIFSGDGWPVVT